MVRTCSDTHTALCWCRSPQDMCILVDSTCSHFIQCGEYRPAVKVSTGTIPPPPTTHTPTHLSEAQDAVGACGCMQLIVVRPKVGNVCQNLYTAGVGFLLDGAPLAAMCACVVLDVRGADGGAGVCAEWNTVRHTPAKYSSSSRSNSTSTSTPPPPMPRQRQKKKPTNESSTVCGSFSSHPTCRPAECWCLLGFPCLAARDSITAFTSCGVGRPWPRGRRFRADIADILGL